MSWIDWGIVIGILSVVLFFAFYSRRYVRGVVDYLAAGRAAGRYMMCVSDMAGGLSVIGMVALVEIKYQTGFAIGFWETIIGPLGMFLALTGYCVYRYRETKALSAGQFLEMRYNKAFRIFAAVIRTLSEMITNAIAPAIAARFFIYYLGFPHYFELWGIRISTFATVLAAVLLIALVIMLTAGQISLIVTDCLQGLLCYPIFILLALFLYFNFSWDNQIAPVMADRAAGESFLNPFDIEKLRDFNLFGLFVVVFGTVLNRASWFGGGSIICAKTPHEQKMAGILGTWRQGFAWVLCILLAVTVLTFMNHRDFAGQANELRRELSVKVLDEVVPDSHPNKNAAKESVLHIPPSEHVTGTAAPLSRTRNPDTIYLDTVHRTLGTDGRSNYLFQQFRTIYHQMLLPATYREILPRGLIGIFCALMIMFMVSTDDSRIFGSAATLIQDVVLPAVKQPLSPKTHLLLLRLGTIAVTLFFFVASLFFVNVDFINMFVTIMTSIWVGGAGPVTLFGLYSRFGTTAGAFSAVFCGAGVALSGLFMQYNWAKTVYPFLVEMEWADPLDSFLQTVSGPFQPYIVWRMDAVKFPINSVELSFLSSLTGLAAYVLVSLLTCRKPFNLDRMLHRGRYRDPDKPEKLQYDWSLKTIFRKMIGITPEFTRADKIITWFIFAYSFGYVFLLSFVAVVIWNLISPWPLEWWSTYFFVTQLAVATVIGVISTVWFFIGGIIDFCHFFKDLKLRQEDPLDNGQIIGGMSLSDQKKFGSGK